MIFFYNEKNCFLSGSIFGAPHAAFWIEILSFLGVSEITFFGTAGALPNSNLEFGEIAILNKTVSDEGISKHYFEAKSSGFMSFDLDGAVTERFSSDLSRMKLKTKLVTGVSTDAIFMETPEKIRFYEEAHAKVIDLEASAVVAVCNALGLKVSVALLVTDKLRQNTWEPGFKNSFVKESKKQLLNWFEQFTIQHT